MRFLLLHRKSLQTPANTHQFNSVSLTHTLKAVLLGRSVLVSEADIFNTAFTPIHSGISKRSSYKKRASNPLNLKADSTPVGKRTHSRGV